MDTAKLIGQYREIATASNNLADWLIRSHTGDARAQALARALQAKLARLNCLEAECAPPGSPYYRGLSCGDAPRHTAPTRPALPVVRRAG